MGAQVRKAFAGKLGAGILLAAVLAAVLACGLLGAPNAYGDSGSAEKAESDTGGTVLSNDALFRCIVRLHPQGQMSAVNVEDNGGGRNSKHVWLYNIGDSSRLMLMKAIGSEDSYNISFFNGSGTDEVVDRRFAIDNDNLDLTAEKRNKGVDCENFQFIQNDDGTYYVYCKKYDKYWGLKDSGYDNKNRLKLVSLADAQKWEMEVVGHALETEDLGATKSRYDSFTFANSAGEPVSGNNWMSKLPGGMRLSDVCIPGAHDSGTASVSMNHAAQCQQFDYTDMLNAGLRYFDLRIGPDTCIVHNSTTCYYRGEIMNLGDVENMVDGFLNENPGETVILQVKIDRGDIEARDAAILELQKWVRSGRVWCGDHVPTLDEVRGKVVIISRFTGSYEFVTGDGGQIHIEKKDVDYTLDGYGQWALDAQYWVDSADQTSGLASSGDNYEVWTQDNYGKVGDTKEHYWTNSIFDETKGAQARRDAAAANGKNAWVISYTSCTIFGQAKYPQEMARDQNPRLISALRKNLASGDRTFIGVICSDFSDEMLAQLVYRHNFAVQHVTVRGITADGVEPLLPVCFEMAPGTSGAHLINRYDELKTYFSQKSDYLPHDVASIGGMLHKNPMASYAGEQEYAADKLDMASLPANGDYTLYVALDRPVKYGVTLELAAPGCTDVASGVDGDDWSGQTPKPAFRTIKGSPYSVTVVNGSPRAYWVADAEVSSALTGSLDVSPRYAYAEIETDFGYRFTTGKASVSYDAGSGARPLSNCKATLMDAHRMQVVARTDGVAHSLEKVEATEPTCVEPGMLGHYRCETCGRLFLSTKPGASPVPEDSLLIPATGEHAAGDPQVENRVEPTCTEPGSYEEVVRCTACGVELSRETKPGDAALGHDWDEWVNVQEATEITEGLRQRTCTREGCGAVEQDVIPSPGHVHELVYVAQVNPGCVTQGVGAHYECACGAWFHDEAHEQEATINELRIPATGHTALNNITPEKANVVEATCTSPGSYRNVYKCAKCGRVLKTEHVAVEALAHDWGEPTYVWSEDGGTVTATRICNRDADHPHVETEVAEVVAEVVQPASCETAGEQILTATFQNEAFGTQTKEEELPAFGHDWDEGVVTAEPTCTAKGVVTYTCANDATHTRTEAIPATGQHAFVTTVVDGTDTATCTQGGHSDVMTVCAVCGLVKQTERQETQPLGHAWGKASYTWAKDLSQVSASHTCAVCGETEELAVDTVPEVDLEPTCESAGEQTVYAVFPSDASYDAEDAGLYAFETQEKIAEIPALGHSWDAGTITVKPTKGEPGVRAFTCARCGATRTEAIPAGWWVRLSGGTRYDTMAAIAGAGFSKSGYAVLATGKNFPDALAASALAGSYDCPVVLTAPGKLSTQAGDTLKKLGVKNVFVMGGTGAVSADVEKAVGATGISVTRVAGATRQETAVKALGQVKARSGGKVPAVIVATAYSYPDALSIGPLSYEKAAPIVLTQRDGTLSVETLAAVKASGAKAAVIVGGTAAVSDKVESQLKSAGATTVTRLAGKNRYETSVAVAEYASANGLGYATPSVATGKDFPDALAGAALAGSKGSVLLLASDEKSATVPFLTGVKSQVAGGYFLGGESAVSKSLATHIEQSTK